METVLGSCDAHSVPCGPVNTARDMLADAHIAARHAIVKILDPDLGVEVPMQAVVPKLSETPGAITSSGPALGAHTQDILTSLGYDQDSIDKLRTNHVI